MLALSRHRSFYLLALLITLPLFGAGEDPTAEEQRPVHPRAIVAATNSLYKQIVCTACDGDGVLTKQIKRRKKDKDDNWWIDTEIEEHPCARCDATGVRLGRNVQRSVDRFIETLSRLDLDDPEAVDRLNAARQKLEHAHCVLLRNKISHFTDHAMRTLHGVTLAEGTPILFTGRYEISSRLTPQNQPIRFVTLRHPDIKVEVRDIRIHNASDGMTVLAGGIFAGFEATDSGGRMAIIRDGFVVRAAPDCP